MKASHCKFLLRFLFNHSFISRVALKTIIIHQNLNDTSEIMIMTSRKNGILLQMPTLILMRLLTGLTRLRLLDGQTTLPAGQIHRSLYLLRLPVFRLKNQRLLLLLLLLRTHLSKSRKAQLKIGVVVLHKRITMTHMKILLWMVLRWSGSCVARFTLIRHRMRMN